MLKRRGFRAAISLGIVGIALAVAAWAIWARLVGVRVVDVSPVDGGREIPITAPIRLAFSQPMDSASVEAHLRIEPQAAGRFVWDGQEVTFWPQGALAPGTSYTVTVEAGASSQNGRRLPVAYRWRFGTRTPELLYLARSEPEVGRRQLYVVSAGGDSPRQLTDHPGGVWDYTVHPQGEAVVYSVLREDGGSDLWRMNRDGTDQHLLLACPEAACLNPAWSPDGRQLAYERRDIRADAPNLDPKAGRIWLFDLQKKRQQPLFDYDVALHSPRWAPQGQRLAYVSPMLPGVEVYDLHTKELKPFGNEWGEAPVWAPDATQLAMPELMLAGESLAVRLVRIDLDPDELVDISGGDDSVKDLAPAWSPGGGWIALGRQFLDEERWTPGRQIWLIRPDGSESYPLLTEPMYDHFALAWRPDGQALAYLRSDLSGGAQPVPDVSVWVFDLVQKKSTMVSGEGILPKWLP